MRNFDKQMGMVLYHSDEGDVSVDAYIMNDSLWITQKAMAELFGVDKSGISRHLKKIFESGELDEKVVVAKIATTSPHGAIPGKTQDKESMFYNLDAIISVGYRVNSIKATKVRIWATTVLKEYMTKCFVLDDDRLKQGKTAFGKDSSASYWSVFVRSEPANGVSGSRLQIFLLSVALITQRIPKWLIIFMQRYRTSFIMQSQIIPLQR